MSKKSAKNQSELEQKIAELNEALLRERADVANIRRRADEEKLKMASYYKSIVIKELLPVIDNFERALTNTPVDLKQHEYINGVEKVAKQFVKALEKLGVSRIKTVGEAFNPDLHDAVSVDEVKNGKHEIVSEELQSGWLIGDKVIRHAMVKVTVQ